MKNAFKIPASLPVAILLLLIGSCSDHDAFNSVLLLEALGPTITEIQPTAGTTGTEVTVSGIGFRPDLKLIVTLDGLNIEVLSASTTQVTFIIPTYAQTGPVGVCWSGSSLEGPIFQFNQEQPGLESQ